MLRTRFEYGLVGASFEPRLPPRPWTPADDSIGGTRIAAGGVPAAYVVRRDALVTLTLRIDEDEWLDYANLVAFGQSGEAFTWIPDADDLGTAFAVYLSAPGPGTQFAPERLGEFPRVLECTLTLRGVDLPPWPNYFA